MTRTKPNCPICEKKPPEAGYKPFCSKRCADVDLSRWLSDSYAIAGQANDQADDTPDTLSRQQDPKLHNSR